MALPCPADAQRRFTFEPRCTHLTMTRLYTSEFVCESCQRPGFAGWLYQCSQDQEDFIEHLGISGNLASMDDFSLGFIAQMDIRKGSAAARERPLSLLDEITDHQIAQYTAAQMVLLLKQREHVRLLIQEETRRFNHALMMNQFNLSPLSPLGRQQQHQQHQQQQQQLLFDDFRKPWNGGSYQECHYIVCARCRPACALRAALSLDAVASGEIPPTAATGYGFHNTGGRPVMDANIVRNLGCRPVPLPFPSHSSVQDSHLGSRASSVSNDRLDVLETQITPFDTVADQIDADADADDDDEKADSSDYSVDDDDEGMSWPATPIAPDSSTGGLRSSPGCANLGLFAETAAAAAHVGGGSGVVAPLAWTPPPTPSFEGTGLCDAAAAKMAPPLPCGHVREASLDEVAGQEPTFGVADVIAQI